MSSASCHAPGLRHETKVQAADARGGRMQDVPAIPALTHDAQGVRGLGNGRNNRVAIAARQCALPDNHRRPLGLPQAIGEV